MSYVTGSAANDALLFYTVQRSLVNGKEGRAGAKSPTRVNALKSSAELEKVGDNNLEQLEWGDNRKDDVYEDTEKETKPASVKSSQGDERLGHEDVKADQWTLDTSSKVVHGELHATYGYDR